MTRRGWPVILAVLAALTGTTVAKTAQADDGNWNFGWGNNQANWSGSDPQEFTVGSKACDYKVRGRSGVWADFKGDMPAGKIVIGVVNPREPDIIFFQLKKASPFLFAAKRTCFQGEVPYVENRSEAEKKRKLDYAALLASYIYIRQPQKISSVNATAETVTTVTNVGCFGGGHEWVKGYYRIMLGACLGIGAFGSTSSKSGKIDTFASRREFYLPVDLEGFYDLPGTPYAAGLDFTSGLAMTHETLVSSGVSATATKFIWAFGISWRFYYEKWAFVPKFGIYDGFSPKYVAFQIGYFFQ